MLRPTLGGRGVEDLGEVDQLREPLRCAVDAAGCSEGEMTGDAPEPVAVAPACFMRLATSHQAATSASVDSVTEPSAIRA